MYGLQHGTLAHTEQQAIKGPKITSEREKQRSNLYEKKRETRNTYKLHKQTTTAAHLYIKYLCIFIMFFTLENIFDICL